MSCIIKLSANTCNVTTKRISTSGICFCFEYIQATAPGNQQFAYAKTKTQVSYAVTAQLISAFVVATQTAQSFFVLNLKYKAFSNFLWLYSLVCVGLGRKVLLHLRTFFKNFVCAQFSFAHRNVYHLRTVLVLHLRTFLRLSLGQLLVFY